MSSYDGESAAASAWAREQGIRSSVGSPVVVEGRPWGMNLAFFGSDAPARTYDDTGQRLLAFTELVAMAVANTESRAQLAASRARVVAAADETRRRIERDLHDGTQQRLISLALGLRAAQGRLPAGQEVPAQWSRTAQGLTDDGTGGADPSRGSGLVGLRDRVEATGGRLEITSPPGGGTSLVAAIPLRHT